MRIREAVLGLTLAAGIAATGLAGYATDGEIDAAEKAPLPSIAINGNWNTPYEPFHVIDNVYYVGTSTVSSWLITTPKGHIVIDGVMPQTAPQIISNIHKLGFEIRDVKWLLNSHAHIDHAGGLAGLQRASGARLVASEGDRPALERGDIGYGPSAGMHFPPVRVDRIIADGDAVSIGGTTLTAHLTPGHTKGCTSWTLDVKGNDGKSHKVFFHCSSTVAGQSIVPETWPGMVAAYRATFDKISRMQADILLANHDNFFDMHVRHDRLIAGDADAFIDENALKNFNTEMKDAFEKEFAIQSAAARSQRP